MDNNFYDERRDTNGRNNYNYSNNDSGYISDNVIRVLLEATKKASRKKVDGSVQENPEHNECDEMVLTSTSLFSHGLHTL